MGSGKIGEEGISLKRIFKKTIRGWYDRRKALDPILFGVIAQLSLPFFFFFFFFFHFFFPLDSANLWPLSGGDH